jgi:hypothetical protein
MSNNAALFIVSKGGNMFFSCLNAKKTIMAAGLLLLMYIPCACTYGANKLVGI